MPENSSSTTGLRHEPDVARKPGWLFCGIRYSPMAWLGPLVLIFLPWVDIRCSSPKGKVTSHFTVSGAQLILREATDRSKKPAKEEAQAGKNNVKVEIAPDAFKQNEEPKRFGGRFLLAVYFLFSFGGLFFAFVQPNAARGLLGMGHSLGVFGLLLAGNWLLWDNPFFPGAPSRIFGQRVTMEYTPWYYCSYVVVVATFLCFGIEWWLYLDSCRTRSST
jgi:hypothetical protein